MITFVMILFIILCLVLSLFIYIQQGKGDMGLGAIGGASQTLFGGSGGQDFFEKATWTMGAFFMLGALGISILRTNVTESRIKGFQAQTTQQNQQQPLKK